MILFGDEAGFAQWGSLSYTWAPKGEQPLVKTCGKRKAYKVLGLIAYGSGCLFWQGQTERFTSDSYAAFLTKVLAQTQQHIILIQDGARYHTSQAMNDFFATHAERLTKFQLPSYSPDFNPIEFLWKKVKKQATHLKYFATFDALTTAVDQTLHNSPSYPARSWRSWGTTVKRWALKPNSRIFLVYSDANNDVNVQRQAFQNFINDPAINAIVLRAADSNGWDALLQAAQVAGKTVVLEDRGVSADSSLYATLVSSDFIEEGRRAGTAMCNLLAGSPSKNVVELAGTVGSAPAIDRAAGFREIAATCGISITQSASGDFNRAGGQSVMAGFLSATHNIQEVYAHNDEMGLGAIQAIKDAGLAPGSDIKVVSIDAEADAFVAMIAGDLNVTVECNPLLAPQAYAAALQALNGVTLPKWIPTDEGVFYQADAGAVYPARYDYYPTSLTSVLLAASPNPATLGANVLLTGTVNAAGAPTGNVQFYRDGVALGGLQALSGKVTTYATSTLSAGAHVITATYSGDGNFQAGVSAKFSVMVVQYFTPPINPGTPAVAVFTAPTSVPQAVTVTVQIPAGALMDTVNLAYTAEPVTHAAPANFNFAGAGFNLTAYTDNVLQTGIRFAVPVTLTLSYDPASLGSLHADELELRHFNGSAWVSDGITVIGRDTVAHQVTVTTMHLTDFALMGPSGRFIYLPLVRR